jgi:acetyl-CoA carboxylase biotin carboxyl carrier protein
MGLAEPMAKDTKGKGNSDQALIRDLAELLEETGLSEIEIEREGMRVRVARQVTAAAPVYTGAAPSANTTAAAAAPAGAAPAAAAVADPGKHPGAVPSPMVGTAYLAPEPSAAPFVEIGARVAQGQTILIIEAMKTMNHIPAPKAGVVTAILVGNGQPVEFGEPLAIIE